MTFMKWDSSIEVGASSIDEGHQNIVLWVNHLHYADTSDMSGEAVGETLDMLVDYVVSNFRREEASMAACNYPNFDEHKRAHKDFEEKILNVQRRYCEGDATAVNEDTLGFVKDWFVDHILNVDKRLAPYVRENPAAIAAAAEFPLIKLNPVFESVPFPPEG